MSASLLIYYLFNLIMLTMLIRVLLSWIPNINWNIEPYFSLKKFTDIFFEPFRRIIPPIGMLDISPVVAFIALSIIQQVLMQLFNNLGL